MTGHPLCGGPRPSLDISVNSLPKHRFSALPVMLALCSLLLMGVQGLAQAQTRSPSAQAVPQQASAPLPPGVQQVVMIEGVTEYRLDNGLTILLAPDDSRAQTTVNMSYQVGSRNEGPGETGMAHLLEHLMFRGSPEHPDALAEFSRRGLAANGSTTEDLTNYYATFASNPDTLRWYLSWQADAMLNASISRTDLDAEMPVVRNEMEQGENSPFSTLLQQTDAASYVWHPYGRSVIGARSDVENVDITQLRAFYHRYYQPDNAVLIVTGRFDADQVLQWVAGDFGPIARPERKLPPEYTIEPVQQGARAVTLKRSGGSPIAIVQYHFPESASDVYTALSLGADMLADSPAGPLYQALVKTSQASDIFGFAPPMRQPGYAVFGAQLQPSANPQAVLDTLEKTLESGGIDQLDQAALDRNRTAWLNQWKRVYNRPASLAAALSNAVARGDWRLLFIDPLRIRALTLDEIRRQLHAWLLPSNRTSGLYLPTPDPTYAPTAPAADLAPWVAQLKTGTPRPTVASFDTDPQALDADTQRDTLNLPNGPVQVALLPKATPGDQVHAYMRLRFGTAEQMRGLGLVPSITAAMLLRGSDGLSRQQIDDQLNALDSDLSFSASGNVLTVALRSSRTHLPDLLALTFRLLRHPAFPASELTEIQHAVLTNIQNEAASPSWLVSNTLQRQDQPWKSDDVRYTPTAPELTKDTQSLTPDALRKFHDRFYGAGNIQVSVVGDFDPQAVAQSLRAGLAGWRQAPAYQRIPDPWYAVTPKTFHIPAPGKANANYLAALSLKLQDTDPRWPALILANHLLGGSEDSRLWQAIRVKGGLSYTVGSHLQASSWEPSGSWTIFATMASQNAAALQDAMRQTLDSTLKTGFTQEEVNQGVKSLLEFLKLGRSNDSWLADHWLDYLDTGRSFAWEQRIIDQMRTLTADQVNDVLRAVLKPEDLSIAVAADPAAKPS